MYSEKKDEVENNFVLLLFWERKLGTEEEEAGKVSFRVLTETLADSV